MSTRQLRHRLLYVEKEGGQNPSNRPQGIVFCTCSFV